MSAWKWINHQVLLLLHDESLAEHGGASGLGELDSKKSPALQGIA